MFFLARNKLKTQQKNCSASEKFFPDFHSLSCKLCLKKISSLIFSAPASFSKHVLVQPSCSAMHSFHKESPNAIMCSWSSVCAGTSTTPCSPAEADMTNSPRDTHCSVTNPERPCSDIECSDA